MLIVSSMSIIVFFNSQEWNDELARVAQAYSAKCTTQPNPDRTSQAPSFSTVGENSGVSMPPTSSSYRQVVGLWFDERLLYNYTTGQCGFDGACDSYTQVGMQHMNVQLLKSLAYCK